MYSKIAVQVYLRLNKYFLKSVSSIGIKRVIKL